jgi:phage-related protein
MAPRHEAAADALGVQQPSNASRFESSLAASPERSPKRELDSYTNMRILVGWIRKRSRFGGSDPPLKDVQSFPQAVRSAVGYALYAAQKGETDPAAKPLQGFGGRSVMEIVTDHRGGTWRSVYTVKFADAVYVLHAFQKKSKTGIATPQQEMDLIRRRLADAERDHEERKKRS